MAVEVEVGPRDAPAGERRVERRGEVGPRVREVDARRRRSRKTPWSWRCELVTKRSGRPSPLASAAATPMPAFSSATPASAPRSSKRKPSGALGRDVQVEPVRVEVVGDVEVEAAVAVDVGEHRAEAVLDRARLDAGLGSDLAEARAAVRVRAVVEVEAVAHARVGEREAAALGDRGVEVGVARDEQVGAAVGVHVADRGGRVPAVGVDPRRAGALDEFAAAPVPEKRVVAGRGDVQVGAPVAVEVGRDAAVPANVEVGARAAAHVHEPPLDVAVERAARQAALLLPAGDVDGDRVRVDGVEVEPAVAVVVEPADAAAHHRHRVGRGLEAEGAVAEVEPDVPGHVNQADAAETLACRHRRGRGGHRRLAARADDHVAAVLELELERLLEGAGSPRLRPRAASPSTW